MLSTNTIIQQLQEQLKKNRIAIVNYAWETPSSEICALVRASEKENTVNILYKFQSLPKNAVSLEQIKNFISALLQKQPSVGSYEVFIDERDLLKPVVVSVKDLSNQAATFKLFVQEQSLEFRAVVTTSAILKVFSLLASLLPLWIYEGKQEVEVKTSLRAHFEGLSCQLWLPQDLTHTLKDFQGYPQVKERIKTSVLVKIKHKGLLQAVQRKTRRNVEAGQSPLTILFAGPPGTGKTFMAKIIAKEAGLPMVYLSADQLLSKWVGETENRIRAVFEQIKALKEQHFLLFIDEIDALAGKRTAISRSWERSQLLTLLQWLEGVETSDNYVLIATTNRYQDLDAALLSRFKEVVFFPMPDEATIEALLRYYAKHLRKHQRQQLAKALVGFSPRAIKNFCETVEHHYVLYLAKQKDKKEIRPPSFRWYKKLLPHWKETAAETQIGNPQKF